MEGGAVLSDVEIAVAFVERGDADAKIEKVADALRVPVAGELGEEFGAFGEKFVNEFRFLSGDGADLGCLVSCAGSD